MQYDTTINEWHTCPADDADILPPDDLAIDQASGEEDVPVQSQHRAVDTGSTASTAHHLDLRSVPDDVVEDGTGRHAGRRDPAPAGQRESARHVDDEGVGGTAVQPHDLVAIQADVAHADDVQASGAGDRLRGFQRRESPGARQRHGLRGSPDRGGRLDGQVLVPPDRADPSRAALLEGRPRGQADRPAHELVSRDRERPLRADADVAVHAPGRSRHLELPATEGEDSAVSSGLDARVDAGTGARPSRRVAGAEEDEPVRHGKAAAVDHRRGVHRDVRARRHLGRAELEDTQDRVGDVPVAVQVAGDVGRRIVRRRLGLEEGDDVPLDGHGGEAERPLLDARDRPPLRSVPDPAGRLRAERLHLARLPIRERDHRIVRVPVAVQVAPRDRLRHDEREQVRGLNEPFQRDGRPGLEGVVHAAVARAAAAGIHRAARMRRLAAHAGSRLRQHERPGSCEGEPTQIEQRAARAPRTLGVAAAEHPVIGTLDDACRLASAPAHAVLKAGAGLPVVGPAHAATVMPGDAQDGVGGIRGSEEGEHVPGHGRVRLGFEDGREEPALGCVRGGEGASRKPYGHGRC